MEICRGIYLEMCIEMSRDIGKYSVKYREIAMEIYLEI